MEYSGEVRRGYFVIGLAGAQFALPEAVDGLRSVSDASDNGGGFTVISASDPANAYNLPLENVERDPLGGPRGSGALLVTRNGRIALSVEARGKRVVEADWMTDEEAVEARSALDAHLRTPALRR